MVVEVQPAVRPPTDVFLVEAGSELAAGLLAPKQMAQAAVTKEVPLWRETGRMSYPQSWTHVDGT